MRMLVWLVLCLACLVGGQVLIGLAGLLLLAGCLPRLRPAPWRSARRVTPAN